MDQCVYIKEERAVILTPVSAQLNIHVAEDSWLQAVSLIKLAIFWMSGTRRGWISFLCYNDGDDNDDHVLSS